MNNTPQPKKTNWGMIILLVVLIPILLLGYKYISKLIEGDPYHTAQNTDFPIGTWYISDPSVNSKYIFDAPQNVNGTLQGQVDMIMDNLSEGKVNYEVIGDGKLSISDPQGSFPAWELGYAYNVAGETLEIITHGHSVTYTRNSVYVP